MAQTFTKSIDVGGVFLMDLSVNEAESLGEASGIDQTNSRSSSQKATIYQPSKLSVRLTRRQDGGDDSMCRKQTQSLVDVQSGKRTTQPLTHDHLGTSLDIPAKVINCDEYREDISSIEGDGMRPTTIIRSNKYDRNEPQSSCSLSDESFVVSSGTSLSASLTGTSDHENDDKQSTTTREDSGVLDLKDLESHLNDHEHGDWKRMTLHHQVPSDGRSLMQDKSISGSKATNLINKLASGNNNIQQQANNLIYHQKPNPQLSICEPTDYHDDINNQMNHLNHRQGSNRSRQALSASLPIQVPVRRMKRDLKNMKLNMMKEEESATDQTSSNFEVENYSPVRKGDRNRPAIENMPVFDDDDDFFDQEYNKNHHNHYPISDLDDEHLTAEEDPMKLFASIQALARSLHEDAELFGSLPPKRMLESPIRSIALV